MKKTLLAFSLSVVLGVGFADNADDKSMTQSLLKQVILPDVEATLSAVEQLQSAIADNTASQRGVAVDTAFSQLVATWKSVQAAYVLGDLDSGMIDTPRLMDTYHEGNERLDEQIKRALESGDEPRIALFKNSFKSINALAILLYEDNELTPVERDYADYVLTTLARHLSHIKTAYMEQAPAFNKNQDKSMSNVLNALIDSSYKLKEWRVGEAAGFAKKFNGKPDSRRQEYLRSGNSLTAVAAILAVHDDMMGQRDYENLGSTAIAQGADKEVAAIRRLITDAIKQVAVLQDEKITDFTDSRFAPLFKTLSQINDAYYQSLVKALPVQARILDADGD